jgi:hypothetical protein
LGHILPAELFWVVSDVFEMKAMSSSPEGPAGDPLHEAIRAAWETGDPWLRACAVRASQRAPSFDRRFFAASDKENPILRAELAMLAC